MAEKYLIRNSTAEFLLFQIEGKEQGWKSITRMRIFGRQELGLE